MIEVKVPRIPLLKGSRELLTRHHTAYLTKALEQTATLARSFTPVGVSGLLRGTINTRTIIGTPANMVGEVLWAQPYAGAVDLGTTPHFPPIGPLLRWAERKLGDRRAAYAIQQKIGKVGTTRQNYVEQTRLAAAPVIEQLYRDQITRYARELVGV